jgi:uncharacterized protein with HEPN domain
MKDDFVYAGHMLDTARLAVAKLEGLDRSSYDRDENLRLALAHLLQTIGEAARQVSPAFRVAHSEIAWPKVIGMRHRIIHDYLHVDFDLVWDVIHENLPGLIEDLQRIVPAL